jgi:hypothetical protein
LTEPASPLPAAQDMKRGHSNKEIWFEADALLQIPPLSGQRQESEHHALHQQQHSHHNRAAQQKCGARQPERIALPTAHDAERQPHTATHQTGVDFLLQQLEAEKSETLTAYLAAMARFHSYSFGNILSIARQRPTATRVAGFYAWKEVGHFVKRGEKGIQILAPMVGKRRNKDNADQNSRADDKPSPTQPACAFSLQSARRSRCGS